MILTKEFIGQVIENINDNLGDNDEKEVEDLLNDLVEGKEIDWFMKNTLQRLIRNNEDFENELYDIEIKSNNIKKLSFKFEF